MSGLLLQPERPLLAGPRLCVCLAVAMTACSAEPEAPRSLSGAEGEASRPTPQADASAAEADAIANAPSREAFFGDLHLHTSYSFDAAASGVRTTPDDAYRYALGEPVEYLGRTVRRNAPLDFLAVTDHAEYLGIAVQAADPNGPFGATEWPARLASVANDTIGFLNIFSPSGFRGSEPPIEELTPDSLVISNWQRTVSAANRYYRPDEFTTFVAYEWSPMPGGAHLHRNVIFRGPAYPDRPFSALDSQRPEDLWTHVERLRAAGVESVLIPHNANMSQGLMFATTDSDGDPITRAYAERRLLHERLVEIAQNKGTSETRPEFSPNDEFAGFELISLPAEQGADPAGGYLRQALARGLEIGDRIGLNPFRFGFVGASDFHSGVSATEEDNFPGGLGRSDDAANAAEVLTRVNPISRTSAAIFSAGALTGVWAEENTRESLFDGLRRREVFATSGTRLEVRLFAGWDFDDTALDGEDWAAHAYVRGWPMGADLPSSAAEAGALRFVVHAIRDPDGANLDRIQIVKIWREDGEAHEAIFDVVWSGGREPAADGRLPAVGNSVDLATASYTNTIGSIELRGTWTDQAFDPDTPAIYYARVLEIPTPRWSTYLAVRNGLPLPTDVPATFQERAWTSPVFYDP